ncbi:hypothetical protein HDV00_005583 [Rhizophlyctis rosea]|nr:hypothetical protein HDV00_005583 [Rhizophlyctis rosea]
MIPTLPIELYPFFARVCDPITARKLRNATRATRKVITEHDLLVAEAGWRYSTKGVHNCWNWAFRNKHEEFVHLYLSEISFNCLGAKVRSATRSRNLGIMCTVVDLVILKYTPDLVGNTRFKTEAMKLTEFLVTIANLPTAPPNPSIPSDAQMITEYLLLVERSTAVLGSILLGWKPHDAADPHETQLDRIFQGFLDKWDDGGSALVGVLVNEGADL